MVELRICLKSESSPTKIYYSLFEQACIHSTSELIGAERSSKNRMYEFLLCFRAVVSHEPVVYRTDNSSDYAKVQRELAV